MANVSKLELEGGGLIRSYGGWESLIRARVEHESKIGDERILGDSQFVEGILREDEINVEEKTRFLREGWDLEKLIQHVCREVGIEESLLINKGRNNSVSKAKGLICYLGVHRLGLSMNTIANRLGISQPAVSKARKQVMNYIQEYKNIDIA